MQRHDFSISVIDTDSIAFSKQDFSSFSIEEQKELINEINSILPEKIKFVHDGYFDKVIVLKTKNYVLFNGKKITYKGSAIKASTKEKALKEFIVKMIEALVFDQNNLQEIYLNYVKEICNLTDIKRWVTRKTITPSVVNAKRLNETKVKDIIQNTEYVPGDRIYVFFLEDGRLELQENFKGEYDRKQLLRKLFDTAKIFANILPVKELFPNYSLKKNQKQLEEIWQKN